MKPGFWLRSRASEPRLGYEKPGFQGRSRASKPSRFSMPLRNLAWLLVVPGFVLIGLAICNSAPAPDRDYKLLRQVVDVLAEIDANFVKELSDEDRERLVEAMINGGLREIDPHSEYLNAEKRKQFESDAEGSFGG